VKRLGIFIRANGSVLLLWLGIFIMAAGTVSFGGDRFPFWPLWGIDALILIPMRFHPFLKREEPIS
jgi:hypothetical protein